MEYVIAGIAICVVVWLLWKRYRNDFLATPEESERYSQIDDDLRKRGR